MKIYSLFFLLFFSVFCFSQQTEEFKSVKDFYNKHRSLLRNEFRKKIDVEKNNIIKANITKDYEIFMQKLDSIENVTLINALVATKTREDVESLDYIKTEDRAQDEGKYSDVDVVAEYPGGLNVFRQELADTFYIEGVYSQSDIEKATVVFIVDKDGKIREVKVSGDNFTFNRQAEIAVYSISKTFKPASKNGVSVRYRYRVPLTLSLK